MAEPAGVADSDVDGTVDADRPDTDESTPTKGPLDVLLFAPVGMVLTAAEDLPGLVTKGRERVQQEINNARVLGEFVVSAGSKEFAQRFGKLFGQAPSDTAASTAAPDDPSTVHVPPTAAPKPAPDPADDAVVEAALAGYDTLSASQVVRRLESLDADQLQAVHRYEASHRNRRTILNRTQQLLDDDPVVVSLDSTEAIETS